MERHSENRWRDRGVVGRRIVVGSALSGTAALLLACSGSSGGGTSAGGSGSGSGAATTAPTAAGGASAAATPKRGGSFSRALRTNPVLDPYASSQYNTQILASYVTARLLRFKTGLTPDVFANFEPEPDLAESFELSPDGLTATVKLRAGAKWQNIAPVSGRLVDAEDVKLSMERFRSEPRNSNRTAFGTAENRLVEGVETPDNRTVVFRLAKPYGPFKNLLTNPNFFWVLSKEAISGALDPAKVYVGCGPFMLDKYEPDIAVTLKRNPDYFGAPLPHVDTVRMVRLDGATQDVSQFQAGQLDYIELPLENQPEVRRSNPKATIIEHPSSIFGFIAFQLRGQTPFRDERVRQALSMAIDRDGLLALAYEGKGVWNGPIPPSFGGWRLDPKSAEAGAASKYFKLDPAESKRLLAAAGHSNLPLRYVFTNNIYGERFNRTAEAIAEMLKAGGFAPQIVTADYQTQYINPQGVFFGGAFEHVFYGLQSLFSDPHDYLFNMYHTKGTRNHSGVNDSQLEAMIDKEGATLDDKERVKQVKDIQKYLIEKLYYSYGATGPDYIAIQEWVKNYHPNNQNFGSGSESAMKLWIDRG